MGSDGAGRPSERPRQGERKPLPRADSCLTSAAERASTAPQMAHATDRLSSAQLGLGSQNEPFQGGTGRLLEFALQGPQISKFLRQNPLELETPNTEVLFRAAHGMRPELPRKSRADQAPGRRFGFRALRQKEPPDLRPPLLGRSIALLFFKARVRQQKLRGVVIWSWRGPGRVMKERTGRCTRARATRKHCATTRW